MKIRLVGAELLHADGQTDVAKLTVAFRNFANAPQNYSLVKNDTPSCTLYKFRQTLLNKRIYIYIFFKFSLFLFHSSTDNLYSSGPIAIKRRVLCHSKDWKCVIPVVCVKTGKGMHVVKHNYVN